MQTTILPIDTRYVYNTLKTLKNDGYKLNIILPINVKNDETHNYGYNVQYFTGINIIRYFSSIESNYYLDFENKYIFNDLEKTLKFILLFEDEPKDDKDFHIVNRFLYEVIDIHFIVLESSFQEEIKKNNDRLKKFYEVFIKDKIRKSSIYNSEWALFQEFLPTNFYWDLIKNYSLEQQIYFINKYIYKEEIKDTLNAIINLKGRDL